MSTYVTGTSKIVTRTQALLTQVQPNSIEYILLYTPDIAFNFNTPAISSANHKITQYVADWKLNSLSWLLRRHVQSNTVRVSLLAFCFQDIAGYLGELRKEKKNCQDLPDVNKVTDNATNRCNRQKSVKCILQIN
jgi:hypothetical protein